MSVFCLKRDDKVFALDKCKITFPAKVINIEKDESSNIFKYDIKLYDGSVYKNL